LARAATGQDNATARLGIEYGGVFGKTEGNLEEAEEWKNASMVSASYFGHRVFRLCFARVKRRCFLR